MVLVGRLLDARVSDTMGGATPLRLPAMSGQDQSLT